MAVDKMTLPTLRRLRAVIGSYLAEVSDTAHCRVLLRILRTAAKVFGDFNAGEAEPDEVLRPSLLLRVR